MKESEMKKLTEGISLVVQCLRIFLPRQPTPVFLDRGAWQVAEELDTTEGLCPHTLQWRGHGFDHGSGKIPHAAGQLSTRMATPEAHRSHLSEKPVCCNWRAASAHHNYRKPACSNEDPAQSKISKNK